MKASALKVTAPKPHFLDQPLSALKEKFAEEKINSYRLDQVCDWVIQRRATRFDQMTNLPLETRKKLESLYSLRKLSIQKIENSEIDPTQKFHFLTSENQSISAVFLPHIGYQTLCISSQVGCAWKCSFCASGLVPFERNLSAGEIIDQILLVEETTQKKVHNILFMGMGEPLGNYNNVLESIRWLTSRNSSSHVTGFAMSPDRITLSTTGLAPQIEKLARERTNIHLALSLHAPNDILRKKIMPISAKFSIRTILESCRVFNELNKSDFTIEYILLRKVNDQAVHAEELAKLLNSCRFKFLPKINLIPNNPVPGIEYGQPENNAVQEFHKILKAHGFIVHTRKAQGQDIGAACGQLS